MPFTALPGSLACTLKNLTPSYTGYCRQKLANLTWISSLDRQSGVLLEVLQEVLQEVLLNDWASRASADLSLSTFRKSCLGVNGTLQQGITD